jgi:predicted GIY-YIG superfamily endonuclease
MTKSEALKLERHIKRVPAGKKVLELTKRALDEMPVLSQSHR